MKTGLQPGDRLLVLDSKDHSCCVDGDELVFVKYDARTDKIIAFNLTHSKKPFGSRECLYGKEVLIEEEQVIPWQQVEIPR